MQNLSIYRVFVSGGSGSCARECLRDVCWITEALESVGCMRGMLTDDSSFEWLGLKCRDSDGFDGETSYIS